LADDSPVFPTGYRLPAGSEASYRRLDRAREIAPIYAANPKVEALIVGGSVARGCADRYSDVEIGVFWREHPSDAEFEAAMRRAGGSRWELDPYDEAQEDVHYEEYEVDGLKIDLRHMTVDGMERVLAAVLDDFETAEERQTIVWVAQRGIVLHGAPLAASWQRRAACYPPGLARAMVARHLELPAWWCVEMYADRGDLPLVYRALSEAVSHILGLLLGLNRLYHPGLKWLDRSIREMSLAPPDLAARIHQAFRAEPREGARQMQGLVEETFALVAEQMPDAGAEAARAAFLYRRPILE
jgi:hypothetical protein